MLLAKPFTQAADASHPFEYGLDHTTKLPEHIWLLIFERLRQYERLALACTCSRFHTILKAGGKVHLLSPHPPSLNPSKSTTKTTTTHLHPPCLPLRKRCMCMHNCVRAHEELPSCDPLIPEAALCPTDQALRGTLDGVERYVTATRSPCLGTSDMALALLHVAPVIVVCMLVPKARARNFLRFRAMLRRMRGVAAAGGWC